MKHQTSLRRRQVRSSLSRVSACGVIFSGLFGRLACSVLIALATASPVAAVTRTYVGPVGGNNWNFAPNWSPSGVPQSLDDVSMIPSDSFSRTCFFDINQPGGFLVRHGTVVIAPLGSGSMSLTNDVGN